MALSAFLPTKKIALRTVVTRDMFFLNLPGTTGYFEFVPILALLSDSAL
jgi:hypothetical protein